MKAKESSERNMKVNAVSCRRILASIVLAVTAVFLVPT